MESVSVACIAPPHTALLAEGALITVRSKNGKETSIPLSSIKAVRLEPPTTIKRGSIWIDLAQQSSGHVVIGGLIASVGGSQRYVFAKSELDSAHQFVSHITERINSAATPQPTPLSYADEIRRYKSLLDDGIITPDEYEIKKRQLLNL